MKALGIAFSARKRGNCLSCLEYILARLKAQGFETETINAYDCEIKPCSHCDYECFGHDLRNVQEDCPVQDDVPEIYGKMKSADINVLAIPTYSGKPASIYGAFTERAQGIIRSYEEFKSTVLNKIMVLLVVGNVPAGGDLAYHTAILDALDCTHPPLAVLFQAAEYGQSSIRGTLVENEQIRNRLDNLVEQILKDWKSGH